MSFVQSLGAALTHVATHPVGAAAPQAVGGMLPALHNLRPVLASLQQLLHGKLPLADRVALLSSGSLTIRLNLNPDGSLHVTFDPPYPSVDLHVMLDITRRVFAVDLSPTTLVAHIDNFPDASFPVDS